MRNEQDRRELGEEKSRTKHGFSDGGILMDGAEEEISHKVKIIITRE